MDEELIGKIKELANQAKIYLDYESVIVFGSYLKNKQTENSDIDIAFIVDEISDDHWTLSAKLFELVASIDNRMEPIILSKNSDKSGFTSKIIEEGYHIIS